MTAKIIVTSILVVLSFICMILSLYRNEIEGKTEKIRAFYGTIIGLSSMMFGIFLVALMFIIL